MIERGKYIHKCEAANGFCISNEEAKETKKTMKNRNTKRVRECERILADKEQSNEETERERERVRQEGELVRQ